MQSIMIVIGGGYIKWHVCSESTHHSRTLALTKYSHKSIMVSRLQSFSQINHVQLIVFLFFRVQSSQLSMAQLKLSSLQQPES
jgi:hypothetical protein